MQASADMEQTAARLEEELQKKEDTIKQQEQYISQLEAKRDDVTSDNEKVKNGVSAWRCIILRDVLGFKDWIDVPMRDQELHQLLNNRWPPLHIVQQQALIVLDDEDSGFRQDAALMALSIWGKASMEYPNLGLDDIVKFATALLGGPYNPSVLAFLEISIKQMIGKELTADQTLFCFRGLELLCRCCPDGKSRSRFKDIFSLRCINTVPDVIFVRATEQLVDALIKGFNETYGSTIKWALEKYGFPNYPLDYQYVLFPVKAAAGFKDQVFLVNDGDKMIKVSWDKLESRANTYTGKYTVRVFDEAGNVIAEKESDVSDNFEPLYAVFPYEDLGLKFD